MSSPSRPLPPAAPTRERLKSAAQSMIAERGVDGVSVRDIVAAAGARNGASVHYYFRTKEALIRELVADGARRIDQHRNAALDALEREGGPHSVPEVVAVLVHTSIEPGDPRAPGADRASSYIRFITAVQVNHRQLFLDALENRWNSGYQRCLRHLRRLLDSLPSEILNQRLILMSLYLGATMAAREHAMEHASRSTRLWRTDWAIANLIDTLCGMLEQTPSGKTLQAVRPTALKRPA